MGRVRIVLYSALICLPALLLVAVGGWFVATEVPKAVRREPGRIGRDYREIAEDLGVRPERASYEGLRKKGWQQRGKIGGVSWGYVVEGDRAFVWRTTDGRRCRAVETEALRPFPYELVFYWGGVFVALALAGLSALAVLCYVRSLRERDDFFAATAHDLTTPLVGMRMMIGRNDGEAKRLNERMLLIVGNLKDFLCLGGRRPDPLSELFDLAALCREAYALFAADYEDSEGGAVTFAGGGTLPVRADATRTLQILWNLFGNDLKYAAPYGKVSVRCFREGTLAKVSFVDSGPGMKPSERRRAFDRYYRAKTVLQSGKGGFGIGLCTARESARAMGGDLTVSANVPKGCVFTLELPGA